MKKVLSLLIVCVLISCSSENKYHIDEVVNPTDTLFYLKSEMSLLNGVVFSDFGDVGLFKNGKREGVHKKWYENGQLEYEVHFKDGKVDGVGKEWYENGQIYSEFKVDGELYEYKDWYENGQLKLDRYDGENKGWYENGEKWIDGNKTWYENGQLKEEKNYTSDGKNCVERRWYESGQLWWEYNYKEGKKHGLQKRFNSNGFLELESNYNNGLLHGLYKWKSVDLGIGEEESVYENGNLIVTKRWNEDGELQSD